MAGPELTTGTTNVLRSPSLNLRALDTGQVEYTGWKLEAE